MLETLNKFNNKFIVAIAKFIFPIQLLTNYLESFLTYYEYS